MFNGILLVFHFGFSDMCDRKMLSIKRNGMHQYCLSIPMQSNRMWYDCISDTHNSLIKNKLWKKLPCVKEIAVCAI